MPATLTVIASGPDPERIPPRPPYPGSVSEAFAVELATRRARRPHADLIALAVEIEQHFGGAA